MRRKIAQTMYLQCEQSGENYEFIEVAMKFSKDIRTNVFALKNNKTLKQTIEHSRYSKLKKETEERFRADLDKPLGTFLLELKIRDDQFYKKFLNKHGDSTYSIFGITTAHLLKLKGVYAYTSRDNLMYIGRCRDAIGKRVNQGYGKIHPKNCYIDGQATNCHLNSLITSDCHGVRFWFHPLESDSKIVDVERRLVRKYSPSWNLHKFL